MVLRPRITALCLCLCLCLFALPAGAQHSLILPGATRSLLLDALRVGDRLLVTGDHGHILYSDDGGSNWTQAAVPTRVMLTALAFPSPQRGWAVGHDGQILVSVDGGMRWTVQRDGLAAQRRLDRQNLARLETAVEACLRRLGSKALPDERLSACSELAELEAQRDLARERMAEPVHTAPLLDVFFVDDLTGLAVGAFNTLLRTTDGGVTWTAQGAALDNPYEFHLNAITGGPDGKLWIAAEGGLLFHSGDGGATWETLATPYEGSWFGIIRAPGTNTLVVFGLGGNAFRSVDGGRSWQRVATGSARSLAGGVFINRRYALLVGAVGTLLVSGDGGASFAPRDWGGRQGLSAVAHAADHAILVGQGGIHRVHPFGGHP